MLNFIHRHLGAKIGELRSRNNMSRDELGREANVSPSEFAVIEAGVLPISAEAMRDLCRALNVDPGDLFEGLEFPCPDGSREVALLDELLAARRQLRSLRDGC